MIEVLVALVILAVGLLGMAGVTMVVMKGGRGAEDLGNVTNICQQKIEELKNLDWKQLGTVAATSTDEDLKYSLGLEAEGMIQKNNLNAQGLTYAELCKQQSAIAGAACSGEIASSCDAGTVSPDCDKFLVSAGPYKYSITYSICSGTDYNPGVPPGTSRGSAADPSTFPSTAAPNCLVDPTNPSTRVDALACESNDILTTGALSPEKMIKILCTWRSKDGGCHYVNFESLRMNNL